MSSAVLVYPRQGLSGTFVRHMPLSILYAAVDSLREGFDIRMLDMRLAGNSWQDELRAKITPDTVLVGISVMTGAPIIDARAVSQWVKQHYPAVSVVWGGPHATFNPDDIFQEPAVDFVISGYGSRPLADLLKALRGDADALAYDAIAGLIHRTPDGEIVKVPTSNEFEFIDYREIPYDMVEKDLDRYGQLDSGKRVFSMYSVMGCPYQCAFCSSPAQYRNIKKKYQPYSAADVADHIQFVHDKYGADYIYFIDDDSFAKLSHVESIIDEINARGLKVGLGFRGARINEIKRMSDEFLTKLAEAGTNMMHIGAETGSQRILDLIKKTCTVDDIIEVNKKMARHPQIKAGYNWLVGIPGETVDELRATQQLMMRLVRDNPRAIIFIPNKFRPLPGTELFELAISAGYERPARLEDWASRDAEGSYRPPWYSDEIAATINMMQVTSYFIDDKIGKVEVGRTLKYKLIRVIATLYAPIAKLRMRLNWKSLLIEDWVLRFFASHYRG